MLSLKSTPLAILWAERSAQLGLSPESESIYHLGAADALLILQKLAGIPKAELTHLVQGLAEQANQRADATFPMRKRVALAYSSPSLDVVVPDWPNQSKVEAKGPQ